MYSVSSSSITTRKQIKKSAKHHKKSPTILENTFNIEAIHWTCLVKGATVQFGSQLVYTGIINGTWTFLTDCVLSADDDNRNVVHVTKPAETCVVGINVSKTQLIVKAEYQQDNIQPVCKLPDMTTKNEIGTELNLTLRLLHLHGWVKRAYGTGANSWGINLALGCHCVLPGQ